MRSRANPRTPTPPTRTPHHEARSGGPQSFPGGTRGPHLGLPARPLDLLAAGPPAARRHHLTQPPRICLGCRRSTPANELRAGRCPDCAPAHQQPGNARKNARPNARLYASAAWKHARQHAITRDGGCVYDHHGDCSGPLTVDHITPLADGGDPLDPANLRTLCRRHHGRIDGHRSAANR